MLFKNKLIPEELLYKGEAQVRFPCMGLNFAASTDNQCFIDVGVAMLFTA